MKYRADIDGLRAIAVLIVVIFHLGVPGFEGGYIGVDVFFVISGFLITSLIKRNYEAHNFKFGDFYFRRIKRLIPPLIATVIATFAVAVAIMTPYDLANFSRSTVAVLFSLSNIVFYMEAGYWDTASELKPLLHTWSLGVEEQFYLFWPALIVGLLTIARRVSFGLALLIISIFGALLCFWYTGIDQSAAFYLLPFRVFQFAVGALVIPAAGFVQSKKLSTLSRMRVLAWTSGLGLIVASAVTFNESTVFPGWVVLIPTAGAFLVLLAGSIPGNLWRPARLLLENPMSLWLGKVSYSLYLVHWPLVALYRYHYGLELTVLDQSTLAVAMLLATLLLHYGVERRFYQRDSTKRSSGRGLSSAKFAGRTLGVAVLLAALPLAAWQGDGWPWRFPSLTLTPEQIREGQQLRFSKSARACMVDYSPEREVCNFEADTQVLIIGNSHEPDGYNFINAGYGGNASINLIMFGNINPCKKISQRDERFVSSDENCQRRLDALLNAPMIANLDYVLYAANKPFAANKYSVLQILKYLRSKNPDIKFLTLGGYINTKRDCSFYVNTESSTDACAFAENVDYFESDPTSAPLYSGFISLQATYIDRVALLCKNRVLQTCSTRSEDGTPMFYDTHHHSFEFSEMTGKLYAKKHPNLLAQPRESKHEE